MASAKPIQGINDLYTWCLEHKDVGEKLLKEYTGIQTRGPKIGIKDITAHSAKKMKWICEQGHIYYAVVNSRTTRTIACPYCSRYKPIKRNNNDLHTWCLKNGIYGYLLITEWTGEFSDGNKIDIHNITKTCGKRVKWKCSEGHEWYATISSRVNHKSYCPVCGKNSTKGKKYQQEHK